LEKIIENEARLSVKSDEEGLHGQDLFHHHHNNLNIDEEEKV